MIDYSPPDKERCPVCWGAGQMPKYQRCHYCKGAGWVRKETPVTFQEIINHLFTPPTALWTVGVIVLFEAGMVWFIIWLGGRWE